MLTEEIKLYICDHLCMHYITYISLYIYTKSRGATAFARQVVNEAFWQRPGIWIRKGWGRPSTLTVDRDGIPNGIQHPGVVPPSSVSTVSGCGALVGTLWMGLWDFGTLGLCFWVFFPGSKVDQKEMELLLHRAIWKDILHRSKKMWQVPGTAARAMRTAISWRTKASRWTDENRVSSGVQWFSVKFLPFHCAIHVGET